LAPESRRPFAKIDPPRLSNVYPRERLFTRLEAHANCRVIWVSAPPGYGKTVTIASWLESRSDPVIWYQCDEGDADIASFFYFLSLAHAHHSRAKNDPLPSLSPELYAALPAFVRNYFREFCARLAAPTFVVLDNWQDVPPGAPLRDLLPVAIGELPAGIVLVVISREEPATNLTRLQVTGMMATLGWAELKLDERETEGIAGRYEPTGGQHTVKTARDLYALTQGWAAGVTVMLRLEADHRVRQMNGSQAGIQTVFNYMISEVLDRLSSTVNDFLLKTACLEYITAPVARELTQNPAARDILDALVRTNAFTLHREASATYYYHPLFRELLRSRAAQRFSAAEQQELLAAAARILMHTDDTEMAINLLLDARQWADAANLMVRMAPRLAQQGRFKTLSDWIEALPRPLAPNGAWLTYWHGMAQMAIAFPRAADTFQQAYDLFVAEDDKLGQMLAIAAILQHRHVSFSDFGRMVPWIGVLSDLLRTEPRFPSVGVELSVRAGLFTAIVLADPSNPRLTECRDRIATLMRSEVDTQSRASAAVSLMNYFAISGDLLQWRATVPDFEWGHEGNGLGPALQIQNIWMHAFQYQITGDAERCQPLLDVGIEIANRHGLPLFATRLMLAKLQAMDFATHAAELAESLSRLEPELTYAPPLMVCQFKYVCAMFHLAQGDLPTARREIEAAETMVRDTGYPLARALIFLGLGQVSCELGRLEDAAVWIARSAETIGAFPSPLLEFNRGLVVAELARKRGEHEVFIFVLSNTLAVGRAQGYGNEMHGYPVFLPRLIPHALEHDIEVEYCRGLIRKRKFRPPAREVSAWPWPIQIHCLGRFEVRVDDQLLEIKGKSQRKPLNLLKAILVSPNGVEIDLLLDRYWPDLDGDAARNAFDLAVHRLRKLLKHRNAVVVTQGRLLLNDRAVWVDAFVLSSFGETTLANDEPGDQVRRLLLLYRGPFLADGADPWMFEARERLRSKFLRCVGELAGILRTSHSHGAETELYQRVLEIEPLAEPMYRSLMHCLIAQGRQAEALRVYQRCEAVLSTLLQAHPSVPTRELYASIAKR
jgi:ATP/maltotriose-dependent transcriptional regulator MalT/DNA-binding SARP family transcriptional activator